MKLSIVIPAYNEESNIGKCLDSILKVFKNKNYDFEIIVVNNASTDRTKEVALTFPGVEVVDEFNKGITKARQAGYKASTGDLIANLDADIIMTEKWMDKVLKEFSKNEKLVALSGPYIYYDLSNFSNILIHFYYFIGFIFHLINRTLHLGAMLQGGNFVLRKNALDKIGGFNTNIDFYGEDTDIACRMMKTGKVKFTFLLPIYTSGRRLKEEGIAHMAGKYVINHLWIIYFKKPFTQKSKDIRI